VGGWGKGEETSAGLAEGVIHRDLPISTKGASKKKDGCEIHAKKAGREGGNGGGGDSPFPYLKREERE